jgi:hypothetical protein
LGEVIGYSPNFRLCRNCSNIGLADAIVDIVSSGSVSKNNLKES